MEKKLIIPKMLKLKYSLRFNNGILANIGYTETLCAIPNFFGNPKMKQDIIHIALVVKDYDEAIEFYTKKLHFILVEDIYQPEQDKRWVVISPPGSRGTTILLARASKPEQVDFIGSQSGGRIFCSLILMTFGEIIMTWSPRE